MEIIFGILGFFIGLFVWSSVWGGLFASIPVQNRLHKAGQIERVNWPMILGSIAFAVVILTLSYFFARPMFIGSLPAAFILLFHISTLRAEELDKHTNKAK